MSDRAAPSFDRTKVVPTAEFVGEEDEETALVGELLATAHDFIESFTWCIAVRESYVGLAIGGVVGVFLLRIEPTEEDVDDWLWVAIGDIPPAYLVLDGAPNPASALDAYIGEMELWVEAVSKGEPVDDVIPVLNAGGAESLDPTREHAEMLASRLRFLRERVLAEYADDLNS